MRLQRRNDVRACRACRDNFCRHACVTQAVARRDRIGQMQCQAVVSANACGNTALRQSAGTRQAEASRCHQQDRLRRQRQRRHQTGKAAANDEDRSRAHTASIRSTARRAGSIKAASTITS